VPDRSRIVEIDPREGWLTTILDLEDYTGIAGRYFRERDTFQFTPPAPQQQMMPMGGVRGGQRPAQISHDNGSIGGRWRVGPDPAASGSPPDLALRAAADFVRTVDELSSRPNRYFEWRPVGASKSSFYECRGHGTWQPTYRPVQFEQRNTFSIEASWPCSPYAVDLPMRFSDPITAASYPGEWFLQAGAAPTASNFELLPAQGDSRLIHMRHVYGSSERISVPFVVGTIPAAAQWFGIVIRQQLADTDEYIAGRIRCGIVGGGQLDLVRGNADGSQTALGTPVASPIVGAEQNWLVVRIEGAVVTVEYYKNTPGIFDGLAPTHTFTHTLTAGDATKFGFSSNAPARGRVGLYFEDIVSAGSQKPKVLGGNPTLGTYRGFRVEPAYSPQLVMPGDVKMWNVPGDLPPKIDVELTDSEPAVRPWFGMGWNSLFVNTTATEKPPFGVIDSSDFNVALGVGWSSVVDASAHGGEWWRLVTDAAGGNAILYFESFPWQGSGSIDPDAFSEETSVEVFALLRLPSTVVQPYIVLNQSPSLGGEHARYTPEYGTVGKPLALPSSGSRALLYRLGTLSFDTSRPVYRNIFMEFRWGAGSSGNIDFDYAWMIPAARSARVRTGIPLDSSYPSFFPLASGQKRIFHDLSTEISSTVPLLDSARGWATHGGLAGSHIEPDVARSGRTGENPALIGDRQGAIFTFAGGLSVPDNPDAANPGETNNTLNTRLSLNAWPRYRFAVHA
jgi:hypothetical protein